ncbi:MAG: hypothetical protein ACRDXB_10275, partial [Actinomycetes bacterium]
MLALEGCEAGAVGGFRESGCQSIRRITRRGSELAVASVLPTTVKPDFSNIALVPTNPIVRSIRLGTRELAALVRAGELIAVADGVVL